MIEPHPENSPVFEKIGDNEWLASPFAKGPYTGLQGGGVAALLAHAARAKSGEFLSSLTTHYLEPAPWGVMKTVAALRRSAGRVWVVDAELWANDRLVALQRSTRIEPRHLEGLPAPVPVTITPEAFPLAEVLAARPGPWLLNTMETRAEPSGRIWFRQVRPLIEGADQVLALIAAADWAHGIPAPMGAWTRPRVAIPNTDLTVHLFREPVGDWTGVESSSAWSLNTIGVGWGALFDIQGLVGRVAMSIAISPIKAVTL